MIPRKLELKNFLSYPDSVQTIDFSDHSLICLSGKNGHGKSALLDAITWALWGQARKVSGTIKADDGLLRLGQTRMMVSLEFSVGEKVYRVRREYAKTYGKPHASFDVEAYDESREKFVSLTDKTIRKTQQKVEELVGLDFDTFINSAFLKQGQSNEFSKKTPKERKQILANILNLSRYDTLQQQALEISRKHAEEKRLLNKLQEQCLIELEKEDTVKKDLLASKKDLEETNKKNESLHKKLFDIEQQVKAHEQVAREVELCTKEIATTRQKIQKRQKELSALRDSWKQTHAFSLRLPSAQQIDVRKKSLEQEEKQFLEQKQKLIAIKEKSLQFKELQQKRTYEITAASEKEISTSKIQLEKSDITLEHLKKAMKEKEVTLKKIIDLKAELSATQKQLEKKLKEKDSFLKQFDEFKKNFEKRRSFYQTLVQRGNLGKKDLENLALKKDIACDTSNPACPMCQQILTAKRKQFLTTQFGKEEQFLHYRLNRLKQLIIKLKKILLEQHEELKTHTKTYDSFTQVATQYEELLKKIEKTEIENKELNKELEVLQKDLKREGAHNKLLQVNYKKITEKNDKLLPEDLELKKIAEQLKALEGEQKKLAFDEKAYQALQEKKERLQKSLEKIDGIKKDLEKQQERKTLIIEYCSQLKELKTMLRKQEQELKSFSLKPEDLKKCLQEMQVVKNEILSLTKHKEAMLPKIGKLENEQQRLEQLKKERTLRIKEINKLNDEIENYQILGQAFSKNGIQALLIEEAIPEIESEANQILAKLTNNQSQIFMESLKDLKSGGVKETLDIKISDSAGIRPYEMFSGGEAFRIDFALRIAISKLLARRAGTALQTLIIDEGFGSQDEEGLTRLMNAIHTIQHDFSKIIIVSHLNEFKDNFPVHFIVEKNSAGSAIRIEQRG